MARTGRPGLKRRPPALVPVANMVRSCVYAMHVRLGGAGSSTGDPPSSVLNSWYAGNPSGSNTTTVPSLAAATRMVGVGVSISSSASGDTNSSSSTLSTGSGRHVSNASYLREALVGWREWRVQLSHELGLVSPRIMPRPRLNKPRTQLHGPRPSRTSASVRLVNTTVDLLDCVALFEDEQGYDVTIAGCDHLALVRHSYALHL